MEQARFWMWAKKKPDPSPRDHGDSWEEQAFAEDAAGALGGCVWPPRSYSCSFCRREFRSAQALGGHMNVHRRDRARLKESPPIHSPEVVAPVAQDPAAPLNACTSQTCTFLYNHNHQNPNPDFPDIRVSSPPPTPAAAAKVINSGHENTTTLSFSPPENDVVLWQQLPSWSSFVAEKRDRVLGSNKNENSVACRKKMTMTTTSSDDDEIVGCKRRRTEEKPSSLFPNKLRAVDGCVAQSEVLKLCPVLVEELDLELRLGRAPKVK